MLQALVHVVESTKTIVNRTNGTVYRAISADAGSKHGFSPTVVIYDELGQAKNRALFDVLDTSMGGREQPLFFVISTQNPDPQHILSELIDVEKVRNYFKKAIALIAALKKRQEGIASRQRSIEVSIDDIPSLI